jgi:hypothetical protein
MQGITSVSLVATYSCVSLALLLLLLQVVFTHNSQVCGTLHRCCAELQKQN